MAMVLRMIESFLDYLLKNRQDAGLLGYLLVTMVFAGMALYKEWIVLGKPYHKQAASCEEKDKALDAVTTKLTDQRILNERAAVTIEVLTEKVRDLELRLARSEGEEWHREQQSERRHR